MFNEFSGFLLELYRLARQCPLDAFQGKALALLQRATAFDSARWGTGTLTSSGIVLHQTYLHNEPSEMVAAYEEVKAQDIPVIDMLRANSGGVVLRFNSANKFRGREYRGIRDYTRSFGHQNTIIIADKRKSDGYVHYVSIYRAKDDHQYAESDADFLRLALPHFLEALTINRVANLSSFDRSYGDSSYVLGIADGGGVMLHCEARLHTLLGAEWPGCEAGRVPAALWGCLSNGLAFRGQHIAALVRRMHGLVFIRVRALCAVDSMSSREQEIAEHVARGHTHKDIASELGISPLTARTHIQRIHKKLGVRNTAELITALRRSE